MKDLPKNSGKLWHADEHLLLKRLWGTMPLSEVAKALKRSEVAVECRAAKLGLTNSSESEILVRNASKILEEKKAIAERDLEALNKYTCSDFCEQEMKAILIPTPGDKNNLFASFYQKALNDENKIQSTEKEKYKMANFDNQFESEATNYSDYLVYQTFVKGVKLETAADTVLVSLLTKLKAEYENFTNNADEGQAYANRISDQLMESIRAVEDELNSRS